MSDQTERDSLDAAAHRYCVEAIAASPAPESTTSEGIYWLTEKLHATQARVRELEAALQQSRDDHQGAVEKLRAEVDGVAASLSERDRALTACNNDFGRALELLRAAERDRDAAQEKLRAVEALADEWDGAADHGEDERYGRIIARTLRGCADDLRKRLGPRPCPKCGGAASWHGDEWSCYGECTGYGRLASPVEPDAECSNCGSALSSPPCSQPDGRGGVVKGHWIAGGPYKNSPVESAAEDATPQRHQSPTDPEEFR
jgi:hypothetical protein